MRYRICCEGDGGVLHGATDWTDSTCIVAEMAVGLLNEIYPDREFWMEKERDYELINRSYHGEA